MKFGVLAVAVLAAVLDHQVVDALASMGLFSNAHAEYRHIALLPTFIAALTLLLLLGVAYGLELRRTPAGQSDWLAAVAARLRSIPVARMFVAIFLLQCCALFAIESLEQVVASGHLADPLAWLGASPPIALFIGLAVAAAATAMLRTICDAVGAAVAMIAHIVGALAVALGVRSRPAVRRPRASSRPRFGGSSSLLASRSGLRAPPFA